MRLLTTIVPAAAAVMAFAPAAYALEQTQSCARGGDERLIEVLAPGEHGKACDLRYTRENGAHVSTPFFADSDPEFCAERARSLAASLTAAGYQCVALSASGPTHAALDANERTLSPETLIQPPHVAQSAPVTAMDIAPDSPHSERPPTPAEAPAASGGPLALAPENPGVAPLRAQPSGYGRLVGASPDAAPRPSTSPSSEPARAFSSDPVQAAAPAFEQDRRGAATPTPAAVSIVSAVRPAGDVIRAVLAEQVAAWNRGDLEAFMETYWKSPDLRFVSGVNVTRGWSTTLNRYRESYGRGAEMGRLSLDGIDVQLVSDDVAVVVGRFGLARANRADAGAFTLVMKRIDGAWRIVHDHTVADPQSGSTASR